MVRFEILVSCYRTALHAASYGNHCESMQQLINTEADLNIKDNRNVTPIMMAASMGSCAAIGETTMTPA